MPDSLVIPLLHPADTASAIATNLAANTFLAVSDPNLRVMACLRSTSAPPSPTPRWARLQGRLGGLIATTTKIRIQYHLGGNPNVASTDPGWKTLLDSPGGHALNGMFYTAPILVPDEAKIPDLVLRAGLFSGDGVADPTLTCAILNLYE